MKPRKAFLLALPIAGLVGCGEQKDGQELLSSIRTTAPTTTVATTKATTTTTVKVTTTKAPTTTQISQFNEVAVVPDSLYKSSSQFWRAQITATNHSSKTSDYAIDFACYFQGLQVDTGFVKIVAVAPKGGTGTAEGLCWERNVDEVRIVSVERDATVGR
jgi:hypothetical protein